MDWPRTPMFQGLSLVMEDCAIRHQRQLRLLCCSLKIRITAKGDHEMAQRSIQMSFPFSRVSSRWRVARAGGVLPLGLLLLVASRTEAIPAFARQMGAAGTGCHTAYPQLNAFGRAFELMGYTLGEGAIPWHPRFALMTTPSLSHTRADATEQTPDFGPSDNLAVTQT